MSRHDGAPGTVDRAIGLAPPFIIPGQEGPDQAVESSLDYINGVLENTAIGKTQTNAYGVGGDNAITVIAIDEAGNRSTAGKTTLFIPF